MKNKYSIIALLVAVTIFLSLVVEAKSPKFILDGEELSSEFIKVVNGRTLISARFISDYFGDRVNWDNNKKTLEIYSNSAHVILKINDRIALINNKPVPLDVQPALVGGQVMVPLRFLTKLYGGILAWDGETKSINYHKNMVNDVSVKISNQTSQVIIDMDSLSQYNLKLYHQPTRLVLDVKNVGLNVLKNLISVNSSIIKQVRISQYSFDPAVVRVTIDINSMSSYYLSEEGSQLILNIRNNSQVATSSIISEPKFKEELKLSRKKIVIDAGHGGHDPGAIGPMGVMEKEVNLKIAHKVNSMLKRKGYNTVMTRDNDRFIPLDGRAEIANTLNADIFISIHANSHPRISVNGTETYAHWNASKDNWALAWYVQSEMIKRIGLSDKGLKAANFSVLRNTEMPAILVESGFLSNPTEERLLKSDNFQQKVAEGIVAGIEKYYQEKN
ncbi:N-acetylmuramoyl-L-alanine amidase [Orenia metallireducens]|jgi:N-acetylmuramoyl-L-alanine amidase|uniref:N-acetylmuramoyl-L-alanine amidase n=1 Tax=Orenia metallireducens TaxID=1413210 RepID=A0A285H5S2_9FIRM|nr:N-acetylmuramoyl-L-alanine amidase family protein [Orenia metallireducens]PRX17800.1 N-acetylmuramoyl-L-alanine amidase [Orenia metallireducens]SNY31132.1 N-acetylmuramoyl-L-alanine amidase [Orenia metallireducens]